MIYGLQANDVLNGITFDSASQSVIITIVLKSGDRLCYYVCSSYNVH